MVKKTAVQRQDDGTIEDVVVKELDFEKLGKGVSDERISRKVKGVQERFDQVYATQREGMYSLDTEAMKDAPKGVKIYRVTGLKDKVEAENIADQLGMYLAGKHHKKLVKRMEELKEKLEKENFDKEKGESEASVTEELHQARSELQKIGFDWEAVYSHLGEHGLDDVLRDSIKQSYGERAPSFEASRYLIQIKGDHKPLLVKHLKGKNPKFVQYKLESKDIDELRKVFAQTHTLYDRYVEPEKADLLEKDMHDAFKHLYRANAVEPKLKEPGEVVKKQYKRPAA